MTFWVLAIWAAWQFGPIIEPHLGGLLADPKMAPWVGRLVILVLVLLLGWVVGMVFSYFTRSLGLGPMDRVIGLFFGIVRGMVLVGLLVIGGEIVAYEWRGLVGPVEAGPLRRDHRRLVARDGRREGRALGEARAPDRSESQT